MPFDKTFSILMRFTWQRHPFKPCMGHMQWLIIQVTVPFSFFYISLQAHVNQRGTHGVTVFMNRLVRNRTWKPDDPALI